jgi:hypothetical protein
MTAPAITPTRTTSPRRAAAARANGAKSRGPITAQGKANSSRNSRRHGLRSRTPLFTDPASQTELAARLAAYIRDFAPQSPIECRLVNTIAVADWRRACLFKLELEMLHHETAGLAPLFALYRLDLRYKRQADTAFSTLTERRALLRECAAARNPEKRKGNERTQQVTESTGAPCSTAPETAASVPVDHIPEKVKVNKRTQQTVETTSAHPVPARKPASLRPEADILMPKSVYIKPVDIPYQRHAH